MQGSVESRALQLVGQIYDAALDAEKWPRLLETIASAVKAHGAMLRRIDSAAGEVGFFHTLGYEEQYVRAYREHFVHLDPYQSFLSSSPVGTVGLGDAVVDQARRRRSEYFNDYELPQDKVHILGATLAREGDAMVQTGIHRGRRQGPFEENDIALLRLIFPHVARAVQLHARLAESAGRQALATAALDKLRVGVILADAAARPFYLNREAEAMMTAGCGLLLQEGRLGLRHPAETARLRALIAAAARAARDLGAGSGGDALLKGGPGMPALHVWVAPLPRHHLPGELAAPASCAALFVSRQGSVTLPWQRVSVGYGLTPAEARLAVLLAGGASLQEAAEQLQISIHTVRCQVKSVFSKTGARRQSELVTLLLQGVFALCRTEGADDAQ